MKGELGVVSSGCNGSLLTHGSTELYFSLEGNRISHVITHLLHPLRLL